MFVRNKLFTNIVYICPMSESRQKKITVNFFLNKNVQPDAIVDVKGKTRDAYPLYISVTYNRKNMQFKSNYGMFYCDLKDVEKGLMECEVRIINKIIRYEHSDGDEDYGMKGLSKRYSIYAHSLYMTAEKYLKPKLRLAIMATNNEMFHTLNLNVDYSRNRALLLYKAAQTLFDNFMSKASASLKAEMELYGDLAPLLQSKGNYDFPTNIDWIDGSYKSELRAELEKLGKDKEVIRETERLIDLATHSSLKELLR